MRGWPQRTRGSRCSRSAQAQGRPLLFRAYGPTQSLSLCCNFWVLRWNPAFPKLLGPEITEMLQSISGPRNCSYAAIWFLGLEIAEMLQSDFWAQKLSKCCNIWARNCKNPAISGPRNCGYAREILYENSCNLPLLCTHYLHLLFNISQAGLSLVRSDISTALSGRVNTAGSGQHRRVGSCQLCHYWCRVWLVWLDWFLSLVWV